MPVAAYILICELLYVIVLRWYIVQEQEKTILVISQTDQLIQLHLH